jgi:DNA-binding transcriptional LysR family regulator
MTRAKAVAAGLTGRVTIGFSPPAMCSDLPKLLRTFLAEYPNVELKLVEGTTGPLRKSLEAGELDFIVVREAIWGESFKTARFARDEINLVLPEGHPLAAKSSIKVPELESEEFILFPRSSAPHYHDRIMSWCEDIGLRPIIIRETDSWIAVLSMIAAGFGLSLGTSLLSRIPFPGVVYRDLEAPALDVGFWISWSPGEISPSAERLLRHMKHYL